MFSRRIRRNIHAYINRPSQISAFRTPSRFSAFVLLVGICLFAFIGRHAMADGDEPIPDINTPPVLEETPPAITARDNPGENNQNQDAEGQTEVFLPFVISTTMNACGMNDEEQAVFDLANSHPGQGRPTLTCNTTLSQVARAKAQDMAERSYFGHVDPDGLGPNYHVTVAGYSLPGWYNNANDSNNIESIAAGYATAVSAWNGWLASPSHKTHVLAESAFWQDQTNIGIGYYYDPASPFNYYWVFISAPPEN